MALIFKSRNLFQLSKSHFLNLAPKNSFYEEFQRNTYLGQLPNISSALIRSYKGFGHEKEPVRKAEIFGCSLLAFLFIGVIFLDVGGFVEKHDLKKYIISIDDGRR